MAVVVSGKIFVNGYYVGSTNESKVVIKEGIILDVADKDLVYKIGGGKDA